jgi:hypothetical protein
MPDASTPTKAEAAPPAQPEPQSAAQSAIDRAKARFAMAFAKVASGRTDLLTGAERSALAGKQTQDGKPYFATVQKFTENGEAITVDVVTDAGRAEAMQDFPQVAALIQTIESQAIFEAATTPPTNEQSPQAATQAQAPVGDPELQTAEQFAASGRTDGTQVVTAAIKAGKPVSVSMAAAHGVTAAPAGYVQVGPIYEKKQAKVTRKPITDPELDAAEKIADEVIARLQASTRNVNFATQRNGGKDLSGGVVTNLDGTITLIAQDMAQVIKDFGLKNAVQHFYDLALKHEVMHTAQLGVVSQQTGIAQDDPAFAQAFADFYAPLYRAVVAANPTAEAKASSRYTQAAWSGLSDGYKGAEMFRMFGEDLMDGKSSEIIEWENLGKNERSIIQAAIDYLVSLLKGNTLSIEAKKHAVTLVKRYSELTGQKISADAKALEAEVNQADGTSGNVSPPATDTTTDTKPQEKPANQATAEKNSDTNEDIPTDKESLTVDPLQDLRDATETIRQGMLAARKAYPQLVDSDLGFDLEDIAYDMAEALATVPADQRKGMVDAAIAAWLEDNIAEKPAKATGTADQKARRKAWRQAAQDKLNAAARAILNSGVHEAFSAVFDKGRITPMPNILGLIRKRRADGKTLTQREIDIWQNESEWNGALKKSNYTGGGQNPLARAMIDLIMARQGEGQSPNTMADALKRVGTGKLKDMDSASDMWEQLAKELRAVTSGKSEDKAGYNPMDDPNYEPTDAEIAEWEAKQAATAQDQDQQPYVTLGDAYGYAIEAFGPDAPITQKIGTISEHADRFYRDDMPSVRAVISAEFARHASGQAIVEAPKPEFEGPAAGFYRFFITTPAEKMREMLASLPVADIDSALFSSPSPGNIRLDLISSFSKPPASYTYETSNERRESILSIARKHGLRLVNPADQGTAIRRFQEVYGVTVTFYEGGSPKNTGFVSGNNIFVNSERNDIPTSWTLTHELIHVGQKDLTAGTPEISGLIGSLLSDTELKAVEDRLLSEGYKRHELATEIPAFLIADAVTDGEVFGFDSFARGAELKASLVDWFDSLQSLNPELLKTATDDELTRLNSSPTQPGFSFDQTTDAGDKGQKGFNFDAPAATPPTTVNSPGRFKPKTLVEFKRPITGPSGAKLAAYEWKYRVEDMVDKRGEDAAVRVSNWEESQTNDATGREVVHQFYVETPDGKSQLVSLESALKILGYTPQSSQGSSRVKSLASVVKTRARNQMDADRVQAEIDKITAALAEVRALELPEVVKTDGPEVTRGMVRSATPVYVMGDATSFPDWKFEGPKPAELAAKWRANRMKERGFPADAKRQTVELAAINKRIAKADAKIDQITGQGTAEAPSVIDTLPPGPNAKFVENTQKAYDHATTDKARENIAKDSAAREGMKNRGKVQNVPQAMMDFGMSGSFGTKDQPGLFSSPTVAPFYSQLARTIEEKMPKQAPIGQVVSIAQSGPKAEEVKWSGLIPWLQSVAVDGKVSKDAVLKYLANEGMVRFEEVVQGDGPKSERFEIRPSGSQYVVWDVDGEQEASPEGDLRSTQRELEELQRLVAPTKFAQYTLPGGENYREIVLAMPEKREALEKSYTVYTINGTASIKESYATREEADTRAESINRGKDIDADDRAYVYKERPVRVTGENYTSSHFPDVPNYVAHMRTNERDGGLFIEELQSDRHQAGRKKGYKGDFSTGPAAKYLQSLPQSLRADAEYLLKAQTATGEASFPHWRRLNDGAPDIDHNAIHDIRDDLNESGVADAPFRTTWPLALFKRALRDAVASGKDWIGWTVGETQNDRFDLSKQVDSVSVTEWPAAGQGMVILTATKDGSELIKETIPKSKIEDYVGKDVARKLMDQPAEMGSRELSGDGLKVGGSGMKGFYDNMLPKEIGKYVKQWGGNVEKGDLSLDESEKFYVEEGAPGTFWLMDTSTNMEARTINAGPYESRQKALDAIKAKSSSQTPIWRIDITPAMKAGVSAGQALFSSPTRGQGSFDFGTTGSFNTRNQPGLDFSEKPTTEESSAVQPAAETPSTENFASKWKIPSDYTGIWREAVDAGLPVAEIIEPPTGWRTSPRTVSVFTHHKTKGKVARFEHLFIHPDGRHAMLVEQDIADGEAKPIEASVMTRDNSMGVKGWNHATNQFSGTVEQVAKEIQRRNDFINMKEGVTGWKPPAESPPVTPQAKSAVQNLWDWASDASASIDPRAPQGNLFDTTPKTTDTQSNDIPSSTNLEPDRQQSNTGNGGRQGGVSTRRGSTGQAGRSLDEGGNRSGNSGQGGAMPAGVPSATDGITGDPSLSPTEPAAQGGDSRDSGRSGRRGPDDGGLSPQRPGANEPRINLVLTPESTGPLAPSSPRSTQSSVTGEWESPLTPEQQGDVEFIDARLNQNGHPGVLLTNGTGTGKTFSGLGAVKQALDRGAKHILVVAPSDKVGSDWKNTAQEFFNIQDAAQLVDTKDNGGTNRLVMTTYANLGQNANLVNRPWDLIVADEAHYLSQNKEGKDTNALDTFRALTFHKNGIFRRAEMLEPEAAEISKKIRKLPFRERMSPIRTAQMEQADRALSAARERIKSQMPAREARPKAILLSATPFAWHFSLDYAEGYLFDHGPEPTSRAYNTPSARDAFYITNFGYRMRTGKLTQPDAAAATATGILERRFAEKLMKEKAMSGRALQVEQDYSRQFILSETKLGEQIDAIIKAIRENPRFTVLSDYIGLGDYLARRYLLEGMKARESVDRIRKHLAMGRKVVVFHDYKKGGAVNPLRAVFHKGDVIEQRNQETGEMETINLPMRLAELKRAIPGYAATERELDGLLSPIDRIEREFPQARIFNGSVPKGQRRAIVDEFNRSGSPVNVILVQRASGKEGISLHDRDAKHQRVFIDIGLANRPTDAIQGEGRIYRHGVRSNAIVEYLSTGTDFERQTFAETIAKRSSTAENLAMGERARSLLQSFANGYNEAEAIDPNDNQGTGGKEMDRQIEEGSSYKTAVALFYTNQKKTSRNKSSEGTDYFATPEPLGFKMVEWADIQPGEKALEPSAGHGAIARFFPDSTNRHGIEPSSELASRLALNATDITIHRQRFEDYNVMNKFNAVVMNPPFGTAGKTAMDHLIKALGHLRNGGRVVALIPEGSSMEKRFDKWYESDEAKNYYVRAEIKLPTSTFERAGTGVSTRVVIIDKMVARKGDEQKNLENTRIDLTRHETLQEFINELEFITVPPRPEVASVAAEEAEAEQAPAPNLITGGRDFILPASIPQPEAETTFSTAEFNHSKTGAPLFVAKIERRLSKEEYARVAASAKAFGGYYSSYNKEGAIPGFHFKSAEARDVFIGGASGESPLGSSPSALFSSPTPSKFGSNERLDASGNPQGIDTNSPGGANIGDGAQPGNSEVTPRILYTGQPAGLTVIPQSDRTELPLAYAFLTDSEDVAAKYAGTAESEINSDDNYSTDRQGVVYKVEARFKKTLDLDEYIDEDLWFDYFAPKEELMDFYSDWLYQDDARLERIAEKHGINFNEDDLWETRTNVAEFMVENDMIPRSKRKLVAKKLGLQEFEDGFVDPKTEKEYEFDFELDSVIQDQWENKKGQGLFSQDAMDNSPTGQAMVLYPKIGKQILEDGGFDSMKHSDTEVGGITWIALSPDTIPLSQRFNQSTPAASGGLSPTLYSSPVDKSSVAAYLSSNGTPSSVVNEESERVSAALAQSGPDRLAEDGSAYSQGDFFAPEQSAAPSQGEQIAMAGARAVTRAKAQTGRDAVSADLIAGLQGDWKALAREVNNKGRASAILADLINREIPVWNVNGTILDTPEAVHAVMLPIRSPYFESLKVMVLDGNMKAVHSQILTVGALNESTAQPAEVLGVLARLREIHGKKYTSIIFSHNHPSGDPSPSRADESVTRRLNQIADIAGWNVMDHIITNGETYYSFRESGYLGNNQVAERPYTPRKKDGAVVPRIQKADRQAPWEAVKMTTLRDFDRPERVTEVAKHLRNGNPDAAHIFYVNTRMKLMAIERVDLQTLLDQRKLTQALLAGRGREGAYGFILDYPIEKTTATILSRRATEVAILLQMQFIDAVTIDPQGIMQSARESGLLAEEPAQLRSSPTQPDLFTAATAPDATQRLGSVKVGTMNALGAYRALTAKRNAGKTLTGEEEQTLLDAEQALGQKLAFDMDAVKGGPNPTKDEVFATRIATAKREIDDDIDAGRIPDTVTSFAELQDYVDANEYVNDAERTDRLIGPLGKRLGWKNTDFIAFTNDLIGELDKWLADGRKSPPTKPAAVFGQNRQAGQDEMSRAGEIDRSGQISLLSSPTPAQDADYLAAVKAGDMETAQRMVDEAARAAGYDIKAYHGGPKGLKQFDRTERKDSAYKRGSLHSQGIWLTTARGKEGELSEDFMSSEASTYAMNQRDGGQIYDLFTKITNPKRMSQFDASYETADNLQKRGYDGAYMIDSGFWVAFNASQIKSADPVTRDASGNVIPLSQRFNPASDSILFSSPTPETIDWKKFPPVFKLVYAAILEGQSVAQIAKKLRITEKAVTNISTQLSTRVQALDEAADGKLVSKMNDGLLERGRPERAMSVSSPEVARILQIRQDNGDPEVIANAETYANAKRMIAADYQGTIERITNRRANGEDLTLDEVAAAQMILLGKVGKKRSQMTSEEKVQLGWLAMDWVEQGTEDARRLQIRRDVTHSPAERAALYFAKELYTPQDKATVEALKKAKGRKAKEEVMKRFMERSEGLKSRLKERGIDLEASLEEFRRQQDEKQAMEEAVKQAHDRLTNGYQDEVSRLQDQLAKANEATAAAQAMGLASKEQIAKMEADAAAMAEKLKKARADLSKARMLEPGLVLRTALLNLTDAQKAAMETLLNGGTIENALAVGGMTQEALKKLYTNFGSVLKKARLEAQALAKQRMLEMPPVLMSSSMESDELRMVGYVPWGELEERKAPITPEQVKVKPKKQPKAKPAEPVTLTPEQQEAIDAAFERFKNADPATWTTLFETESKTLAPLIGQVGFEEFKGRLLQPWKDRWQTEMDGIANPSARITFEEWIAKPSTQEIAKRERDLFPEPINETTGTFDTTAPNREGSLFPAPINETTGTWNDTRPYTSQGELIREEISTTTGLLDFNDPLSVRNALREISTGRSSTMDRVMEWWRASILSGPQTAAVNTASNLSFGAFNAVPRRAVEASVNSLLKLAGMGSTEAATFGEFASMAQHLRGAARLAGTKMLQSWREESANFKAYALATENQLNFGGKDWEQFEPALPGKVGTFMRSISFRHMQAADEFMKFFFGQLEAAAQAYRIAQAEGLKGAAREARITQLIETRGSEAWIKTYDIMQRNTFQEKMVALGEGTGAIRIFDSIAMKAKNARRMPYLGRPITFFLPFIDTPTNVTKQAVEISPLGGMLALIDGSRALKRRLSAGTLNADGMRISKEEAKLAAAELYDKERFVKDMTNQVIAWGLYFAISAMVEGDDDELPLITGTMAYTITQRGERDVAERVMPPQSIRIPGTNTFMSYSRMDPFATIMAGMVDMTRSLNREGGMNSKVATDFLVHTKNAMKDKTFLQGVSNLINALEDPSRVMERLSAGILTGFVPNLIRQPIREADMMKRDVNPRESDGLAMSVAKRIGYSIVPASAPLKIDVWGRELPANHGEMIGGHPVANAIFRTLDPTNLTVGAKIDPLDLYIFTWNNEAQDTDKISITPIEDFVTGTVNGKSTKFPLTVAEQTEANRRVGRQAYEFLIAQGLDHRATSKQGAELITDAFRSMQRSERERLRNEKLAAMPPVK